MDHTREQLEKEADYWRVMIKECREIVDEQQMFRMQEALLLIEYRLEQLVDTNQ
jgi:hypothetical protein